MSTRLSTLPGGAPHEDSDPPLQKADAQHWQVRFDSHSVTFRSEHEARQFVATLEARLQAPHPLPLAAQRIAS